MPMAGIALMVGFASQGLINRPTTAIHADFLDTLAATAPRELPPDRNPFKQVQVQRASAVAQPAGAAGRSKTFQGLPEPAPSAPLDLEIRVALLGAGSSPTLSATGPWTLLNRAGAVLQRGQAGQLVSLGWTVAGQPEAWLQTSGGSLLVNGKAYGGRLRLISDQRSLQLVNHLPLELYISSVVGAEMPSGWSMEALKAQAVAARSYALAHMARPAHRHWHVGDTTRWQAYRGLSSVNARTSQAAADTAGMILSYQGGIVESLYAATQKISSEAHGHLGASMSQHGAQNLARQGYAYHQILGHYYRGASLARLKAGEAL